MDCVIWVLGFYNFDCLFWVGSSYPHLVIELVQNNLRRIDHCVRQQSTVTNKENEDPLSRAPGWVITSDDGANVCLIVHSELEIAGRRMESDMGKLFIGGISWDTNEARLREYFENFGEVVDAVIMKDKTTGRARGFGFVVFSDPGVAEKVVMEKHLIDGRMVSTCRSHLVSVMHQIMLLDLEMNLLYVISKNKNKKSKHHINLVDIHQNLSL